MKATSLVAALLSLLAFEPVVQAQAPALQRIDKEPLLRVEANGPTAHVNALAFSPDGNTLYFGGYDKVVRLGVLAAKGRRFEPGATAYRVPIGPGVDGTVNALAVSRDGKWLAAAGYGLVPGKAGFREAGRVVPKVGGMSEAMRRAEGVIYLFDLATGDVRRLEGHLGPVLGLTFLPARDKKPARLVSLAIEHESDKRMGGVRIWDVAEGKQVHSRIDLLALAKDGEASPIGLDAWHTGNAANQLRVAVAWNDGLLRVWDVAQGQTWELPDGKDNVCLAYLPDPDNPDQGRLFTASFQAGGRLQAWSSVPGKKPEPLGKPGASLGETAFPRAMSLFASKPGGKPDHAAVVTGTGEKGTIPRYRLHVIDLNGKSLEAKAEVFLWEGDAYGRGYRPSVTASPCGRFVAVAGNSQHRIPVFDVADLLARGGQGPRPLEPVLRSDGATISYVAFGKKKDGGLGLVLSETRGKPPGTAPADLEQTGLVFDFGKGVLTAYRKGEWQDAGARLGKWDVRPDNPAAPTALVVTNDGKRVGSVALEKTWRPGSIYFRLLPPRLPPPADVPLLALAYDEGGEVVLALYNGRSGEPVRILTGHVNPIRSLAFSDDGQLLATAAEDQTVCVWTLADLDKVLGQQGQLRGLPVVKGAADGTVALAEPDETALADANKKELKARGVGKGDGIEAVVLGDRAIEVKTPPDFYNAVWRARPGAKVTLRVRGKQPVSLVVGQGTDEQKPLLSLFVTRGARPEVRQWVGWNPTGPYDFSNRDAERLLGWHTNTGEADKPVSYALAGEYRKQHHKPEILRLLVEHRNTGLAVEAWKEQFKKKIEPGLTLEIAPPSLTDAQGRTVARQKPQTLVLTVAARHPDTRVGTVRWRLGDGAWANLKRTGEREWSADLAKQDWKRGEYRVRVELETEAPEKATYSRGLTLLYQPALPSVRALAPHPVVVKDNPRYSLKAEVIPSGAEPAEVRLLLNGEPVPGKKWLVQERKPIEEVLDLKPGKNVLQLAAHNQGHEAEKDTLTLEVAYQTTAPEIALDRIEVVPTGKILRLDGVKPGDTLGVDATPVRVVGKMEALTELDRPVWVLGDAGTENALALKDDKTRLTIDQAVELKPGGQQKLRFLVGTKAGERVERSVIVEYRPRLPELAVLSPAEEQAVHEAETVVQGQLLWPADRVPCKAALLLNGKAVDGPGRSVETKQDILEWRVALQPGENRIQVKLTNPWYETLTPESRVNYRRPPRIVPPLRHVLDKDGRSFVEIQAQAESAAALPLTRVELNGRELHQSTYRLDGTKAGDRTVWKVAVPGVPVQKGSNPIRLRVANADGWSKPEVHEIKIAAEQLPRPKVLILDPQRDVTVEDAAYVVHFGVQSASPLQKVELRRGREVIRSWGAADLKGKDDFRDFREPVKLQAGNNSLTVTAQNDGGEQVSLPVVVTYQLKPIRIRIEGLELPSNQVLVPQPSLSADGWVVFGQVREAKVHVRGRVLFDRVDEYVERLQTIRLLANGQQQRQVRLLPVKDRPLEKTFREVVELDKADNQIEVKLPAELIHEAGSRRKCRVSCQKAAPRPRRQPHLVVFDTERTDTAYLFKQLFTALEARPMGERRFKMEGFTEEGILHGPLVGSLATPERLNRVLDELKRYLRAEATCGSADDVVYFYLRASEAIFPGSHVFQPGDRPRDPELRSGIDCETLEEFFSEALGRGVMFVDVARLPFEDTSPSAQAQSRDRIQQWPDDPHVVVMRYVWWGQPAKQKPEARLSTDLAQALPPAKQLRDVKAYFEKKFAEQPPWLSHDFKQLTLFLRVPAVQLDLPVGR